MSRTQWRTTTLASILLVGETGFHDNLLLDILRDGLQRWLQDLPPIQISDYPTRYGILIVHQTRIGWSHLFRGRWSHHWKRHHTEFARTKDLTGDDADGTRWVRRLGTMLIKSWFDLWDIRNKERHGKDEAEQLLKRESLLRTQLEALYKLKSKVLPSHRKLFMADAETHMTARPNLDGLQDWINTFGPAIQHSVKERLDIRRHFFRQGDPPG